MYMMDTWFKYPKPNILSGKLKKLESQIKIDSGEINPTTKTADEQNIYEGHIIYSIEHADRPFRSTYTGYYGLGVNNDFNHPHESNLAYQLLKDKKIDHLVTSLFSCEDMHVDKDKDGHYFVLKYGGFSKLEAGIVDDVAKLEVVDKSWKVMMEHAVFDS